MGALVFLTTFFIYAWGAYPTVTAQDAGELIVGPATLSIVHPSGYPLYVVLGHVWNSLLPLGSVAFRINLFSGALTACALWGVFILLRTHLPSLLAACVAIGIGVTATPSASAKSVHSVTCVRKETRLIIFQTLFYRITSLTNTVR